MFSLVGRGDFRLGIFLPAAALLQVFPPRGAPSHNFLQGDEERCTVLTILYCGIIPVCKTRLEILRPMQPIA